MVRITACLVFMLALLLTGCGDGGSSSEDASGDDGIPSDAAASESPGGGSESADADAAAGSLEGTVRIGAPIDESGPAAFVGTDSRQGMELALERVNGEGMLGEAELEILFRDHQGDADQATLLVRELIRQDQVSAVTGVNLSQIALAVGPIAQQEEVPVITDTVVLEDFATLNDFTFLAAVPYITQIEPFVQGYAAEAGWQRAVVFRNVDIDTLVPQTEQWTESLGAAGIEVLPEQTYASDAADFSAQLTAVRDQQPDVIVLQDLPQLNAAIMRQAGELGIEAQFTGTGALLSEDMVEIAGASADGTVFPSPWHPDIDNPQNQQFVEAFRETYDEDPGNWNMQGYTAVILLTQAIADAGSDDPTAVRDALAALEDVPTPYGDLTFDESGVPRVPGVIVEIADDSFELVGPLEE